MNKWEKKKKTTKTRMSQYIYTYNTICPMCMQLTHSMITRTIYICAWNPFHFWFGCACWNEHAFLASVVNYFIWRKYFKIWQGINSKIGWIKGTKHKLNGWKIAQCTFALLMYKKRQILKREEHLFAIVQALLLLTDFVNGEPQSKSWKKNHLKCN